MGVSTGPEIRLLGLGNEVLADDAFGIRVAREAQRRFGHVMEVVTSSESGFNLIDHLLGASSLIVVDTLQTGTTKPGTIHVFDADEINLAPATSPHYVGLFEVLTVARMLGLHAPGRVTIIAVEAADCSTLGGAMHPDVEAAIPLVTGIAGQFALDEVARHG